MIGNSDWKNKLRSFHVPPHMIDQLDHTISNILETCSTMILTGSWATGQGNPESDLDILLCVEDVDTKFAVKSMLRSRKPKVRNNRRIIDIKVLVLSEISNLQDPIERFSLLLQLKNCVCLWGIMPMKIPKFSMNDATLLIGIISDELNEGFSWLENNSRYTQAVIQITNSLKSLYYLNHLFSGDTIQSKTKMLFLKDCFGESYPSVTRTYNIILIEHFDSDTIVVNVAEDRKIGIHQYAQLLEQESKINAILTQVRKHLTI